MRLTAILLFVCLQVSAGTGAQTISLSLRNASVEQAFKAIEKQTDYRFVYTKEDIKEANLITVQVSNANLAEALHLCFQGQPIMYTMNEKFIVVKNKSVKITVDVKGKVTNEKGDLIEVATVIVKGTNKYTYIDKNGELSLNNKDKEGILVFGSVNMETFELKVNGQHKVRLRAAILRTWRRVAPTNILLDDFIPDRDIDIKLNDIESITVLKDADAASIWGTDIRDSEMFLRINRYNRYRINQFEQNNALSNTAIVRWLCCFYNRTEDGNLRLYRPPGILGKLERIHCGRNCMYNTARGKRHSLSLRHVNI